MMRLPSASGCAMSRPLAPGNIQALKFVEAETDEHKLTKSKMNNSRWRGKMVIQDIRTVSIHAQGACLDFPPSLDMDWRVSASDPQSKPHRCRSWMAWWCIYKVRLADSLIFQTKESGHRQRQRCPHCHDKSQTSQA